MLLNYIYFHFTGKNIDALKIVLENAPLASNNKQIKVNANYYIYKRKIN